LCQCQMGLEDSELESFVPIAFNKNGQKSNMNLEVMTRATRT
jgi:hypothetical protein